jgi:hypothetical protein
MTIFTICIVVVIADSSCVVRNHLLAALTSFSAATTVCANHGHIRFSVALA